MTPLATVKTSNVHEHSLSRWLLESGIQRLHGSDAGGVHAWIDCVTGKPAYLYSEITGYFITLACHLARVTGDTVWLSRAALAGEWIIGEAMLDSGAILTRKYDPGDHRAQSDRYCFARKLVVFFDSAMVGYGMLKLHAETGDRQYLDAANAIGRFCITHFLSPPHLKPCPVFDLISQRHCPEEDRWSLHWGSFNLKGALFFAELADATGDRRYDAVVDVLLSHALQTQQEDGRFITTRSTTNTHLHPHHYTIEGLLYMAWKRGRTDLLWRARAAIDFAFRMCLNPPHLMVHAWPDPDHEIVRLRSDVVAQSLRCYYIAKQLDPSACWSWEEHVPQVQKVMNDFVLPDGGTSFGLTADAKLSPHANAWCHFFHVEMRLHERYAGTLGGAVLRELVIT